MRSVNECLLVQVIDLEWPLAYEEACPWKHVMNALRYTFDHEPDEATTLIAIGDPLQVDTELLTRLQEARLMPGATVHIEHFWPRRARHRNEHFR